MTVNYSTRELIRQSVVQELGPAMVPILHGAYARTRDLVASAGWDPLIHPMGSGYTRYMFVQSDLRRLQSTLDGCEAQLQPNANNGQWYHIEIKWQGLLGTVESVSNWKARPRSAKFRTSLAQGQFVFTEDRLRLPDSSYAPEPYTYVHFLHSRAADRSSLGFLIGVFQTADERYDPVPVWLYFSGLEGVDWDDMNAVVEFFDLPRPDERSL